MVLRLKEVHFKFRDEMAIVGRILTDYGELEITLMNCVAMVRQDMDGTLKSMFRVRSEKLRIAVADALARTPYAELGLGNEFSMAISDMEYAMAIRNQYAHCIWDAPQDVLRFADMEPLANRNQPVRNFEKIEFKPLSRRVLDDQLSFLAYIDDYLAWINHEGRVRMGVLSRHLLERPKSRGRPPRDNRPNQEATPRDSAKGPPSQPQGAQARGKPQVRARKLGSARKSARRK